MKSKTISSILRHVATKLPTVGDDPASVAAAADSAPLVEPTTPALTDASPALGNEPAAEPELKETKRARRQRAHAEQEEAAGAVGGAAAEEAAASEEARLETIYEKIAWPLHKKYGHTYDAFKLALTEPDTVFGSLTSDPPPGAMELLKATIARRLTPQPIKLRADIELTCYTPAGIDAIKRALKAGEKASSEQVPIRAKLVAPPLYVLTTNATDKFAAVDRLERSIEAIQNTIEEEGGNLVIKMKVYLQPSFYITVLLNFNASPKRSQILRTRTLRNSWQRRRWRTQKCRVTKTKKKPFNRLVLFMHVHHVPL